MCTYMYYKCQGDTAVYICYNFKLSEMTITVDSNNCGGSINLDSVQTLHLKYYGAELNKRYCLYNVTSNNPEMEICIYNHDHKSWDIACDSSVNVHIGKYYGYNYPSVSVEFFVFIVL